MMNTSKKGDTNRKTMRLQRALLACLCLLAFAVPLLMAWILRLDATLEGDATLYGPEPVEHCSLKKEAAAAAPRTPIDSYFVYLDWDPNPPSDNVTNYILYMGTSPGQHPARIVLGNQTTVRVLKNHPITYCTVSAKNATAESGKSNEVNFTNP